jgi:hypothetical protein
MKIKNNKAKRKWHQSLYITQYTAYPIQYFILDNAIDAELTVLLMEKVKVKKAKLFLLSMKHAPTSNFLLSDLDKASICHREKKEQERGKGGS